MYDFELNVCERCGADLHPALPHQCKKVQKENRLIRHADKRKLNEMPEKGRKD